jgi:serine/threonine-protein kinase RsbW
MTPDCPPLTLVLPSDLCFLSVARAFVEAVCRAGGIGENDTNAIILATHEAANNIMRHAYHDRPAALLQIQCRYRPEGLEVCLLDDGAPFDVATVPDLDPGELRVGGRGVFLMRALMDELSCAPRGDRGNVLRMFKRCRCHFSESLATRHSSG